MFLMNEKGSKVHELGLRDKITLRSGRFLLGNSYASLGLIDILSKIFMALC